MDAAYTTTPLNHAYFGKANVDAVQRALIAAMRAKGHVIDRQSDNEVLGVMRGVFESYSTNADTADPKYIAPEIARINAIVHKVLVDQVTTGIQQYLGYIKDASTLPEPLSRGVNASSKGDNFLQLR